ncbi:MAG: FHA domain-containing protein [Deltaproteobacteria bacterium]|nr:FHA domain-containing protein [Deltaproteobacteria bacterium]
MGANEEASAYIVLRGPGHDGTCLALREGITSFGRLPSNDVILLGDLVSRHHARITYFDGRATLQDLGSHNGSWVNGERISTRVLRPGDTTRIGNFRIDYKEGLVPGGARNSFDETTTGEDSSRSGSSNEKLRRPRTLPKESAPTPRIAVSASPSPAAAAQAGLRETGTMSPHSVRPADGAPNRRGVAPAPDGPSVANAVGALGLVCKASSALARAPSTESYVRELLALAMEEIRGDVAAFFRVEDGRQVLLEARNRERTTSQPDVSMAVVDWVVSKNFLVTSGDISSDLRFGTNNARHTAVLCVPVTAVDDVIAVIYLGRSDLPFTESEVDALSAIAQLSVLALKQRSHRDLSQTRETLAPFYAPDVLEQILQRPAADHSTSLDNKTATVVFADIPGFNTIVENLEGPVVSAFASHYLDEMSEIIQSQRGALQSQVGMRLMATFGTPFSYGNDAARAVGAALQMRETMASLIARFPGIGTRLLRIGLSTGHVMSGAIGSARHRGFLTLGEPVSVAARLEVGAAPGTVILSESTYAWVRELFEVRRLGLQQVRGQPDPIQVYEVLGKRSGAS